jgi:hypothetical protein
MCVVVADATPLHYLILVDAVEILLACLVTYTFLRKFVRS